MENNTIRQQVTMYYDGGCPLCAREVGHYRRVDKAQKIRWINIDQDDAALRAIGVSKQSALQRLHVTDGEGKLVTGAFAFQVIWKELPGYRWLAMVVSPRPILVCADYLYGWFARYRFSRRCTDHCM